MLGYRFDTHGTVATFGSLRMAWQAICKGCALRLKKFGSGGYVGTGNLDSKILHRRRALEELLADVGQLPDLQCVFLQSLTSQHN